MSVALYARVSTDRQVSEGESLRAQEETLLKYCKTHGITDYKIYLDEGYSAKKPYNKRKVMVQLLNDIEAGKIHLVLFIKLDRWMRSVREYHKVQEILDRNHCSWRATEEDYETETANGRMTVNIMLSVNENEAERVSERVKYINKNKVLHGEPITMQPYGYKIIETPEGKRIGVDEDKYRVLQSAAEKYIETKSAFAALRYVNEQYGLSHTRRWIAKIFDNFERYSGEYRGISDYRPRLFDDETIRAVKKIKDSLRGTRVRKNTYLFTSILTCPCCGRRLTSHTQTNSNTGKAYVTYSCGSSRESRDCTYKLHIREKVIEEYLLDHVKAALSEELEIRIQRSRENKSDHAKEKTRVKEKIRRLARMYEDEILSDEEYDRRVAELKAQLKDLEEITSEGKKEPEELNELLHTDIIGAYNLMDREAKKVFWLNLIESIDLSETERKVVGFTLQ